MLSILVTQSWLIVGRSLAAARESRVLARINVAHGATQIQPISALLTSEAAKYIRSGLKHHSCQRWSRANSPPSGAASGMLLGWVVLICNNLTTHATWFA